MQSMTGYGRGSASSKQLQVDVAIRSVNGRYLDVRVHLPKRHLAIEQDIVKACKDFFSRGTVDVNVHAVSSANPTGVQFNVAAAQEWLKTARQAAKALKLKDTLTAQDVLTMPQFQQKADEEPATSAENAIVLKAVQQALKACAQEREREGDGLRKIILSLISDFQKMQKTLTASRDMFKKEMFARLEERMKKLLQEHSVELDSARVLQEVAHMVEKTDVEEELMRFLEHVRNVEKLLKSKGTHGKKLDFYAQELLREVNTIGSKSQYATITETVVELKSKIEQFREQVQNIE